MEKILRHDVTEMDMLAFGYGAHGACTRMYWADGEVEELPLKQETMLREVAEDYGKSLKALRQHWRMVQRSCGDRLLGRMEPLVISPLLVLMPVSIAMDTVGRDRAVGYINLSHAPHFLPSEASDTSAKSRIVYPHHSLPSVWGVRTLRRHYTVTQEFLWAEIARYRREFILSALHGQPRDEFSGFPKG